MRFFSRRWACRPSRSELRKDVDDIIDGVLSITQSRPTVYNELAKYAQQWISEIAELDEQKRQNIEKKSKHGNISCQGFIGDGDFQESSSVCDSATMNEEDVLSNPDIDWSLPNISKTPNSIEEIQLDYDLLKSLNLKARRNRVRHVIRRLIDQLESDIALYKDIRREKALRSKSERDAERNFLIFVLDQIENHPHVYNQVLVRLHSLGPKSRQRNNSKHERWKKTLKATSKIRWSDVQCLDELMDFVPTESPVRDFLHVLRESCRAEAKTLTRLELRDNSESPPTIHKLLLRSGGSNDFQSSPLSNYHVIRTLSYQGWK